MVSANEDDDPVIRRLEDQIDFYVGEMALLGKEGVKHKTEGLRRKLLQISTRIEVAQRSLDSL